ncbi:hypothetical protein SUGI_0023440 [Cryptomeria japonica]|nr:hypothetical protein SUGI_0023440 [Cryptomeria japonica]
MALGITSAGNLSFPSPFLVDLQAKQHSNGYCPFGTPIMIRNNFANSSVASSTTMRMVDCGFSVHFDIDQMHRKNENGWWKDQWAEQLQDLGTITSCTAL